MKLQVSHITKYSYQEPVIDSVNEVRLTPNIDTHQICCSHSLIIEPNVPIFTYKDYFGNIVHYFTIPTPHHELFIQSHSIVETIECDPLQVKNHFSYVTECKILASEIFKNSFAEYLMETDYTRVTPELQAFFSEHVRNLQTGSVYQLLEDLSSLLYSHFTYDTDATHVHTTVEETLRLKRGVCQDYAHLMIAICRLANIPSRYISGYQFIGNIDDIETDIQHASHAWVEAYVPRVGWIGFDPTNNGKIDWRYIKIGHGRDYQDIVPVKGVYQGASGQKLEVFVDVKILK